MKSLPCCPDRKPASPSPLKPRPTRIAGFLLSGASLFLIPKCPACLAAWLTLATGLSVSSTTAGNLRFALIIFICGLVAVFTLPGFRRHCAAKSSIAPDSRRTFRLMRTRKPR